MGSQESKIEQTPKQEQEVKENVPNDSASSTPILTPIDPRSPSVNIARTPLELILGAKTPEAPSDELEDDNVETKDIVSVVLSIDPRSPTVEFNRTPIIVGAKNKEKPSKLQNKKVITIRQTEIQTTPVTTARKSSTIVPPKLLGVSPVSVISNSYKRKSFVGLLETNIDFTETDLDKVCQAKDNINKSLPIEVEDDLTCNQIDNQIKTLKDKMSDCQCTPETFIEHYQENEVNEVEQEVKEGKDLETVIDKEKEVEKVINVTAHVKDFDKKLTNLIYQDNNLEGHKIVIKVSKVKENNRTPLSMRNANEDPKRVQRLKVSDKPRKSESKIPILKDHQLKKVAVQCENTPPLKMDDVKYKIKVSSRWDADKTLII